MTVGLHASARPKYALRQAEALIARHSSAQVSAAVAAVTAEKDKEIERLMQACARQDNAVCQTLGKALGYPELYPDASDVDDGQVCVGEHIAETIAAEAAVEIERLRASQDKMAIAPLIKAHQ